MARELGQHALAAKAIRADLKRYFPKTKFSVTSQSYSMGDSVYVEYTDGPTSEEVRNKIRHYQYGHFDGMTDCYEMSNNRKDIPQTKFVQVKRNMSDKLRGSISEYVHKLFGWKKDDILIRDQIWQTFSETDYTEIAL
jgi:hypothetical protein